MRKMQWCWWNLVKMVRSWVFFSKNTKIESSHALEVVLHAFQWHSMVTEFANWGYLEAATQTKVVCIVLLVELILACCDSKRSPLWCIEHSYYGAALGCTDYQHLDIIPDYSYDMHHICERKQTYKKKESWNINVHIQQVRYHTTVFSTFHKIHINTHRLNLIDISSYVSTNVGVRPELSLAMKVFLVFGPGG